ncbi:LLM class flavin-dependent oxidoreductase [Dactylosporangium sp. NPDC000555]|uniref:LLM class flavin-dependent oxidoreductase n=1 Tax=Dactylosporangium sp. NPDC000555 TaxID=3154260 RepID=UPI0033199ACC
MTAKPFRLGFFTHANTASPPAEANEELVRLFVGAEELGYDIGFLAQHLLVRPELGSAPSPLVSFAPVAVHTHRIGLGVAVVTLPLTEPLQLANDALTLDGIAGGRLQLGLGTGAANIDKYAAYGVDASNPGKLFDEHLGVLLDALSGRPLRGTDQRIHVDGTGLAQRLWRTPGSPESARRAARTGLGALFGTATLDAKTVQRPIIDAYLDEWRTVGPVEAPSEIAPLLTPRLGGIRNIYAGASRAGALDDLNRFLESSRKRIADVRGVPADDLTFDDIITGVNLKTGSAQDVAEGLRADAALLPEVDYIIAVTGLLESVEVGRGHRHTVDVALRGLERIARDTAPLLGWTPAT